VKGALVLMSAPLPLVLFLGAGFQSDAETSTSSTVNVAALPPLAREMLRDVEAARAAGCPELPLVWLVAQVQAESSWDPRAYSPAGAAGLLQMLPGSWVTASGGDGWSLAEGPPAGHPVWDPITHLRAALPWMCANLRLVVEHLAATGKPTEPLDALAVCHVAGCSRVTGSASGIPTAGEAGCGATCAATVTAYIDTIHRWEQVYSPPLPATAPLDGAPAAYQGGPTGCVVADPTGTGGCVTGAAAWLLQQVAATFPPMPVTCWDEHAWNPTSDHPQGRACDYTFGQLGAFPDEADTARGWQLAEWLRSYADQLRVAYIVWQGRIWSAARSDEGWRPYGGGGIYDPADATGGHYDHVHVSVTE
jgi:Transglycosylase SLT domain